MLRTLPYAAAKFFTPILLTGILLLGASQSDAQILHRKKKTNKSTSADNNVQPDKVLYDRAADDIKRGRHEVGRLNLQTLINTYPDSEYLAKAKLLIADSYYKEGGTANMTQAISGYKDFIVFFPFLPEASYAQLQVAMGHFQQMEKPDRDRTEAKEAEAEFQTFLQKYPKDPLADKAMQHLREVQEVIAEGDFRVASYYYVKGDKRAAAARLIGITRRYPLFSKADRAYWMLGEIFESSEKKEIAANYYSQIVKNYPLSEKVPDAKGKLVAMKVPVPQPDPKAQAWMVAEQNAPRPRVSMAKRPLALLKTGPTKEMHVAARVGAPNLEPEADSSSATDVLTGGGSSSRIVVGGGSGTARTTGNSTGIVATVTPGAAATDGTTPTEGTTEAAPADGSAPAATDGNPPPAASGPETAPAVAAPAAGESSSVAPAAAGSEGGSTAPATTDAAAPGGDAAAASTDAAKTDDSAKKDDKQKESTSKKKKGVRKLVPW